MNDTILSVKNLTTVITTDKTTIKPVDNISFEIKRGEIVGLVGESGSGKSMTSLSILGLLPKKIGKIKSGNINFNGQDLTKLKANELRDLRGRDISVIFQEPMTSLNPVLTIGDQIGEVFKNHFKYKNSEIRERTIDLLKKVRFPRPDSVLNEYPHQLSGGMRQRIMIAMAIACKPKLIIADEPTTALDVTIQAEILQLLVELATEYNMALLLITHDLGVVNEVCDKIFVMYAGQIVEENIVNNFFKHPGHPYSRGLLNSIPRMSVMNAPLSFIKGNVPPLDNLPEGCRFSSRCPERFNDICGEKTPPLIKLDENHKSRCWLYSNDYNES